MLSYQLAMDLTGANIANVNTPGYSRQRAVFEATGTVDVGSVNAQIGVGVTSVERIYDQYLDNQVTDQAQLLGYSEAKNDVLSRLEGVFAEREGGVSDSLNKFWNAWSELAANPRGQVERENLLVAGENVTATFRRLESDLTKVEQDTGENIINVVAQVNDYLAQLADLNGEITGVADDKGETNLLRDKRTDVLNKLSGYLDINYVQDASGAVNIFLANGRPLLMEDTFWQLAGKSNGANVVNDIVFLERPDESLKNAMANGKKGKLAALLEVNKTIVPGYREKLDTLANNLIDEVNLQHAEGYDGYGNVGGNFFDLATDARNFRVSTAVAVDVQKIAASATVNGDGENARSINALRDKSIMSGGAATVNNYYASFIAQVGRDAAEARSSAEQQTSIMEQLYNRRESTSGVSLDEEMMDLMKFQMGYNAAGKLVSTANQIMDILMQLVK